MSKPTIYLAQFGTGTNINLLPLAAGQLAARLKEETELLEKYELGEIIFRRPANPKELVAKLKDVFIISFSCFLWNINVSLQTANEVKKKFPDALIVVGGPSIPKDSELVNDFFHRNSAIDIICVGEGEDIFTTICTHHSQKQDFADIPGIIYRNTETGAIHKTAPEVLPPMERLPSPYLDGTFDDLYKKYSSEFSGIIWETNRGCPYTCSFCTWGNLPSRKIREKPMDKVKAEIEWIGKNQIEYIAMSDSNFGIRPRDVELTEMLMECKNKYGVPNFISVSWAKHSPEKVLKIGKILKKAGIGFRVTLSLQSLNEDVLKAVNRSNIKKNTYQKIKDGYRNERLYSYTELILGLPMETYHSFVSGIEESLSDSIFDQLYVYPLFLFPNTQIASLKSRKKYKLESKFIEGRYTKSKESEDLIKEFVEIVIGTSTMPKDKWVDSFVIGYYTLALHDDRLAFFILIYLKKNFDIRITDLICFVKDICVYNKLQTLEKSFAKLINCAEDVQNKGKSHLIEPSSYGGIPFDPPEGIFLELLYNRDTFYSELLYAVELFLENRKIIYDKAVLQDLFVFQKAVMAHPDGPITKTLNLKYDWIDYLLFTFNLKEKELIPMQKELKIIDRYPCHGSTGEFLKHYFDVRGVPAFNEIMDESGKIIFPPVGINEDD